MFTEALNAPLLMILVYGMALLACIIMAWRYTKRYGMYPGEIAWTILAAMLLGAGLALLGAAYLHDVWYC